MKPLLATFLFFSACGSADVTINTSRYIQRAYPPDMQGPVVRERANILPVALQGNSKHVKPGASQTILNITQGDDHASVYTLNVYPLIKSVNALFNGSVDNGGSLPAADPAWRRFAAVHRVRVAYGQGAANSESVYCDLKRGFKMSLSFSSLKVDVFNVNKADLSDEDFGFDVGATVAPGGSDNNDGLTLTAFVKGLVSGGVAEFPIPPHAKSYFLSVQGEIVTGGVPFHHTQTSDNGVGTANFISEDVPSTPREVGPYEVAGDSTQVIINNTGADIDIADVWVVWHLNL